MKSKLTFFGYWWAVASIIAAAGLITLFFESISEFIDSPILFFIKCLFFFFIWFALFWGELRTKIISVDIENHEIFVKRYCGLGITQVYRVEQIDGFKTSILSSRGKRYECLYLMITDKKIAEVSEFYHSNYKDLKKQIIANGIKCIGTE